MVTVDEGMKLGQEVKSLLPVTWRRMVKLNVLQVVITLLHRSGEAGVDPADIKKLFLDAGLSEEEHAVGVMSLQRNRKLFIQNGRMYGWTWAEDQTAIRRDVMQDTQGMIIVVQRCLIERLEELLAEALPMVEDAEEVRSEIHADAIVSGEMIKGLSVRISNLLQKENR